jgi:hypothetical protein
MKDKICVKLWNMFVYEFLQFCYCFNGFIAEIMRRRNFCLRHLKQWYFLVIESLAGDEMKEMLSGLLVLDFMFIATMEGYKNPSFGQITDQNI